MQFVHSRRQLKIIIFCYFAILIKKAMFRQWFPSLFSNELTLFMDSETVVDVRVLPDNLLLELDCQKGRTYLKKMGKQCSGETEQLKMMTLLNMLIVNSDLFYEEIYECLDNLEIGTTWICRQAISPLRTFLKRSCETYEHFTQCKQYNLPPKTFISRLPYIVNLLDSLCKLADPIPRIGRYFIGQSSHVQLSFCQSIVVLMTMLYSHLKNSLEQFLFFHRNQEEKDQIYSYRDILQWLFKQKLPEINEQVQNTVLNKYFSFYEKGIASKLFKINEQNQSLQDLVYDVIEGDEEDQHGDFGGLESQIFPSDGSFNENLYLSALQGSFISECQSYSTSNSPHNTTSEQHPTIRSIFSRE